MTPVAWDRLADARSGAAAPSLSIVTMGHVHADDLMPLTPHFAHLEQLVLDVPPRAPLAAHRAELNRAIDAGSHDWILILRERERISEALAVEIARAVTDAKARGFRLRSVPLYAGAVLRIGADESDIRLFHRRYYMRFAEKGQWQQLMVQGTVVRLGESLSSVTFESEDAHREYLSKSAQRRTGAGRMLTFVRYLLGSGTLDRNTLRYLWIEAGYR